MIKLYTFGPNLDVPDPSPFVLKIITYLHMAKIEYQSFSGAQNLSKAPKGKLPFIIDDGKTIADSQFIIAHLEEKYEIDLDSHLSEEEKATAYLFTKSLEEGLYWCLVHSRWADEKSWAILKKTFFGSMPFPLKLIVPSIARNGVISALKKQGTGLHSEEEIQIITQKSLQALSSILGNKTYFFGDTPCTFDATAFAFLSEFINTSLDHPLNKMARKYDNLVNYCDTMKTKYY